jgi:cobalt-zinc-cadmium resistance protein CzcA
VLQAYAEKVKGAIADVPGVADLGIVKSGEVPADPAAAPTARPWPATAWTWATSSASSRPPSAAWTWGTFWEGEIPRDLVLRFAQGARDDVEKIRKLPIAVSGGGHRAARVAGPGRPGRGTRLDQPLRTGRRYIGIRMNVRGRDLDRSWSPPRLRREDAPRGRHHHRLGRRVREQAARHGPPGRWSCRWR